jgi:hypothetical protein
VRRSAALVVAILVTAGCSGGGGGDEEAFCATARRFVDDNPAAVFDRFDPADPAVAADLLRREGRRLHDWAGDAPSEVSADVESLASAADDLADTFDGPPPSADQRAELAERNRAVAEASARVTTFVQERCGVALDRGTAPGATTSATTATTAPP